MLLEVVAADVASQLEQQAALGVDIEIDDAVPDHGPVRGGVWLQIPEVTAVFADIKGSTALNNRLGPRVATHAYTFFNRAMVRSVQRQLLLPVPSIILAGSPPVSGCAAGPLRCGSWGRRIPG